MAEAFEGDLDTRVLCALLTERTIKGAAERAGVSRTTVYARLHDPAFMATLEAERERMAQAVRQSVAEQVADGAAEAVAALRSIVAGGSIFTDEKDRLAAARLLLEAGGIIG